MTTTDLAAPPVPLDDDDPRPGPQVAPADLPPQPKTVYGTITKWEEADLRPVLPAWVRNRDERRQLIAMVGIRVWSASAGHAVRVPWYTALAVIYTPRGAARLTRRATDLLFDGDGRVLRRQALDKRDTEAYLTLLQARRRHVKARTPAAVLLGLVTTAGLIATMLAPAAIQLLVLAAGIAALGRIGAPEDRPIVRGRLVHAESSSPPTSDVIIAALRSLGGKLAAKDAKITFAEPIRVDGPGWRADIDLPHGVTAAEVMAERPALSSAMRRPLGCVWPEGDAEVHEGRLVLWVGRRDLAKTKPAVHPFRKGGTCDYFAPIPWGVDQRGRPVTLLMEESNLLIGSLPGGGKTATVRCVGVGAALDPTVELHVWEHKGSGDLESFERIAHVYGSGLDDSTLRASAAGLSWLRGEVERRSVRLGELRRRNRDLVPDSKVTRELANRRALGLHPLVYIIDECQNLFMHPDVGKQAGEDAAYIIRLSRALGIYLVLATQRPDKESLPTGVSANVGTRFCLRVMDQTANDMILGTSSYKNGIRATTLRRSDRGIGYLVGAGDEPQVTRPYYLDAANTDAIVARAYLARERGGLLTGMAAGEVVESGQVVDFLADVATVLGHIEVIWSEDLLARLAELRPELYGGWTLDQLAQAFKPSKISPRGIKIEGTNRNGYRKEWVIEAMARRELER